MFYQKDRESQKRLERAALRAITATVREGLQIPNESTVTISQGGNGVIFEIQAPWQTRTQRLNHETAPYVIARANILWRTAILSVSQDAALTLARNDLVAAVGLSRQDLERRAAMGMTG